ncbi:hypothetical protein JCM10213_008028 [Rhodosporidiobolus nylandii]
MPSLLDLPEKLIADILRLAISSTPGDTAQRALGRSLSLVCRRMRSYGQAVLYRDVVVEGGGSWSRRVGALKVDGVVDEAHLAEHVRTVKWAGASADSPTLIKWTRIAHKCPHIKQVSVEGVKALDVCRVFAPLSTSVSNDEVEEVHLSVDKNAPLPPLQLAALLSLFSTSFTSLKQLRTATFSHLQGQTGVQSQAYALIQPSAPQSRLSLSTFDATNYTPSVRDALSAPSLGKKCLILDCLDTSSLVELHFAATIERSGWLDFLASGFFPSLRTLQVYHSFDNPQLFVPLVAGALSGTPSLEHLTLAPTSDSSGAIALVPSAILRIVLASLLPSLISISVGYPIDLPADHPNVLPFGNAMRHFCAFTPAAEGGAGRLGPVSWTRQSAGAAWQ